MRSVPSFTVSVATFTSNAGAVAPGHEGGVRVDLKAVRAEGRGVRHFGVGAQAAGYSVRHAQAVEGSVVLDPRTVRAAQLPSTAALVVLLLFALAVLGGAAGLAWSGGTAILLGFVEVMVIVVALRSKVRAVFDPDDQLVTICWRD
jgi:hypothetical protein